MADITPEEIESLRLGVARRVGQGYDARQVDDFLDAVAQGLREGTDVAGLARAASFTITRRAGEGYDACQVDELIDRITGDGAPGETTTFGDGSRAWSTSTQMLPEEPGLFARLFGRR